VTLEFCALASGSRGNAVYVGSNGAGVLVDVGLSARSVALRMEAAGIEPARVRAVVLTHEHRDHAAGVAAWCRRHRVPVWMTEGCLGGLESMLGTRALAGVEVRVFASGEPFEAAGLGFLPVRMSHDAADPVGFRVTDGRARVGLATDLGLATQWVREALRGMDLLYVESNHDEERLWNGPYPWPLKQRVRSRHGHLSNRACSDLVADLLHPGLRCVVLGHLSQTNNEPRLAYAATRAVLGRAGAERDVTLLVARQDRPGRVVRL